MLKLIGGVVGAVVPQLGLAVKFGPYIVIAALGAFAVYQHSEIATARAQTALEAGRVTQAVQQCQAEASQEASKESAAAVAQIQAAQEAADAATAQLLVQRRQADQALQASVQALAAQNTEIDTQAARAGQDGPVPPVLGGLFQ